MDRGQLEAVMSNKKGGSLGATLAFYPREFICGFVNATHALSKEKTTGVGGVVEGGEGSGTPMASADLPTVPKMTITKPVDRLRFGIVGPSLRGIDNKQILWSLYSELQFEDFRNYGLVSRPILGGWFMLPVAQNIYLGVSTELEAITAFNRSMLRKGDAILCLSDSTSYNEQRRPNYQVTIGIGDFGNKFMFSAYKHLAVKRTIEDLEEKTAKQIVNYLDFGCKIVHDRTLPKDIQTQLAAAASWQLNKHMVVKVLADNSGVSTLCALRSWWTPSVFASFGFGFDWQGAPTLKLCFSLDTDPSPKYEGPRINPEKFLDSVKKMEHEVGEKLQQIREHRVLSR
jgi:hypothetical protein